MISPSRQDKDQDAIILPDLSTCRMPLQDDEQGHIVMYEHLQTDGLGSLLTCAPTFFSMSCFVSCPCGSYLSDRKTRPLQPSLQGSSTASRPTKGSKCTASKGGASNLCACVCAYLWASTRSGEEREGGGGGDKFQSQQRFWREARIIHMAEQADAYIWEGSC